MHHAVTTWSTPAEHEAQVSERSQEVEDRHVTQVKNNPQWGDGGNPMLNYALRGKCAPIWRQIHLRN